MMARRSSAFAAAVLVGLGVLNVVTLQYFATRTTPTSYRDNIGGVDMEWRLAYSPIDVVYTWVNGSDPVWRATKERYRRGRRLLYDYDDYAARYMRDDDLVRAHYYGDVRSVPYYDEERGYVPPGEDDDDDDDDYVGSMLATTTTTPAPSAMMMTMRNATSDASNATSDVSNATSTSSSPPTLPTVAMMNATLTLKNATLTVKNASSTVNETSLETLRDLGNLEEEEPGPQQKKEAEKKDDSASESRYRDSEELRYSLRSLERFAPWIRHIYLVTDNQIPYWLNLDDPKITVVPHAAIFENRWDLPVFSSPAIESQLHRVPGVSRRFVYFNDDVLLGAPTFPDDFVSLDGAQRVYLAWDAPKCNDGCHDTWLGDGICDEKCNVSSCDFDYPDCLPENVAKQQENDDTKGGGGPRKKRGYSRGGKSSASSSSSSKKRPPPTRKTTTTTTTTTTKKNNGASSSSKKHATTTTNSSSGERTKSIGLAALDGKKCAPSCVHSWIGDGSCDVKCDVESCLYDLGDCRGVDDLEITPHTADRFIDVKAGSHGVVVNVSEFFDGRDERFVHGYVEERAPDAEVVVYDVILLKKNKLMAVFLDGRKTTRVSVALRSKNRAARANFTGDRFYLKEWSAGIVSIRGDAIRDETSGSGEKTRNVSFHFRLYDPSDDFNANAYRRKRDELEASELLLGSSANSSSSNTTNTTLSESERRKIIATEMQQKDAKKKQAGGHVAPPPQKEEPRKKKPPTAAVSAATCDDRQSLGKSHRKREEETSPDLTVGHAWSVMFRVHKNVSKREDLVVAQRTSVVVDWKSGKVREHAASYAVPAKPLSSVARTRDFDGENVTLEVPVVKPRGDDLTGPEANATRLIDLWSAAAKKSAAKGVRHTLWLAGAVELKTFHGKVVACAAFVVEAMDDWHLFDDDDLLAEREEAERRETRQGGDHRRRRRRLLLDTYGESLSRVNRMYTTRYGKPEYGMARRVPAHMPHMIDAEVVRSMKREWPEEWRATARNRFRSGRDMQYAFAYFHYVMIKAKISEPDFDQLWRASIDTNGDGVLDGNEIITLASLAHGKEPSDAEIDAVYDCVVTAFSPTRWLAAKLPSSFLAAASFEFFFFRRRRATTRRQRQWDRFGEDPYVGTLKSTKKCATVVDGVSKHAKKTEERRNPGFVVEPNLNEVAFEMLGDDYNRTKEQLDSIRARQVKFICVNDNVEHMTPELFGLLSDFFTAYYPRPSRFELPPGQANAFLRLEDYRRDRFLRRAGHTFGAIVLAFLVFLAAFPPKQEDHVGGGHAAAAAAAAAAVKED